MVSRAEERKAPIQPLGHWKGRFYLRTPSGELRDFSGPDLEHGKGLRALVTGAPQQAEDWCMELFPPKGGASSHTTWDARDLGMWIIARCNEIGLFDPGSSKLRSIGVWRDADQPIAHCGNKVFVSDSTGIPLLDYEGGLVLLSAPAIRYPSDTQASSDATSKLRANLAALWGWARPEDPELFLGWLGAAFLGAFPAWRVHLLVTGSRGSGKSTLIEVAADALGDLAGDVLTNITEAGVRQNRASMARPLLVDEFEPEEGRSSRERADAVLQLLRSMNSGDGSRTLRGSSDHGAKSFVLAGPAYLTAINHVELSPQDHSRFLLIDLGPLPEGNGSVASDAQLREFRRFVSSISPSLWRRMLDHAARWDRTHGAIAALARNAGADARQADTAATILAGRDLLLHDGEFTPERGGEVQPLIEAMICNAKASEPAPEGEQALEWLLDKTINVSGTEHSKSVREIIQGCIANPGSQDVGFEEAALRRAGIYVLRDREAIAVRTGKSAAIRTIYDGSKWQGGAHTEGLKKLEGVHVRKDPVRVGSGSEKHRVVLVPFSSLPFET